MDRAILREYFILGLLSLLLKLSEKAYLSTKVLHDWRVDVIIGRKTLAKETSVRPTCVFRGKLHGHFWTILILHVKSHCKLISNVVSFFLQPKVNIEYKVASQLDLPWHLWGTVRYNISFQLVTTCNVFLTESKGIWLVCWKESSWKAVISSTDPLQG